MSYADPSDLAKRFDRNDIADLASDTGVPVPDIDTDPNVLAALEDASGDIDSALLVSNLYTPLQLTKVTGNSLAKLKRITCELAMAYLMGRRPEKIDGDFFKAVTERNDKVLERLQAGKNLFNLTDDTSHEEAGLASIDGPTVVDYERLNMIPDRTRNFYPHRGTRLPIGRGGF